MILLAAPAAASAAGALTGGFGRSGIAKLGTTDRVLGVAAERNGGVVAVGSHGRSMLVVRLSSRGTPGRRLAAGTGVASAVVIQSDGKIVVAGNVPNRSFNGQDLVVKRFNVSGSPDRRFGTRGTTRVRNAVANGIALAPGGKVVAGGYVRGSDTLPRVALVRLRSNGALDRAFGRRGISVIDLGRNSQAKAVGVQRDGRVVFGGEQIPDLRVVNALIGRVSARGVLDRGFGSRGVYFYFHPQGGGASSFSGLAVDSRNRVLGAGGDQQNSGPHALFVRLSRSGHLDSSFGTRGIVTTPSARNYNGGDVVGARGIAVAGRGEVVATGAFKDSGLTYAALWALTPGGRLDASVGPNGLRMVLPSSTGGESHAVAVARTGAIFSGGDIRSLFTPPGAFVARYSGFGSP